MTYISLKSLFIILIEVMSTQIESTMFPTISWQHIN